MCRAVLTGRCEKRCDGARAYQLRGAPLTRGLHHEWRDRPAHRDLRSVGRAATADPARSGLPSRLHPSATSPSETTLKPNHFALSVLASLGVLAAMHAGA